MVKVKNRSDSLITSDIGWRDYFQFACCDARLENGTPVKFSASVVVYDGRYYIEVLVFDTDYLAVWMYSGEGKNYQDTFMENFGLRDPLDLARTVAVSPFMCYGAYNGNLYLNFKAEPLCI